MRPASLVSVLFAFAVYAVYASPICHVSGVCRRNVLSSLREKAHSAKAKFRNLLPNRPKSSPSLFFACGSASIREAWRKKGSILLAGNGSTVYKVKSKILGQEVVIKAIYFVRESDVPEIEQEVQNLHKVQQLAINGYGYAEIAGKTVYLIVMKYMGDPLSKTELKSNSAELRQQARKEYSVNYGLVINGADFPEDYVYREEESKWKAHPINWAYAVPSGHKPKIKVPDVDYCIEHWRE